MKIVVGVDGSKASQAAVRFAVDEAAATEGDLVAVTSWEITPLALGYVSTGDAKSSMGPWLDSVLEEAVGAERDGISQRVETGSASGALLRVAKEADHLIVGSRGHGALVGAILGSVSRQLASHAPCPLTVIPAPKEGAPHNSDGPIVVGIDGSANATTALHWAADRALRLDRPLRIVMAWRGESSVWLPGSDLAAEWPLDDDFRAQAQDMLAEVVEEAGLPDSLELELVLGEGTPTTVIREVTDDASMLVLGARGRGGFMGLLLGSVTSHLLNHLDGPTTVVPADGSA